jgi:hypothetical protein
MMHCNVSVQCLYKLNKIGIYQTKSGRNNNDIDIYHLGIAFIHNLGFLYKKTIAAIVHPICATIFSFAIIKWP